MVKQCAVMFWAVGRLEDEQVGEVQAPVVAGELEIVALKWFDMVTPGGMSAAEKVQQGRVDLVPQSRVALRADPSNP